MLRPLRLACLALALAACSADETAGVSVLALDDVSIARGARYDFQVTLDDGVLAPVTAISSDPAIIKVETIDQPVGRAVAKVQLHALEEGRVELELYVGGTWLERRSVSARSAVAIRLDAPRDQPEPTAAPAAATSPLLADARSTLALTVHFLDDDGGELAGRQLLEIATDALPASVLTDEVDHLMLEGGEPGTYVVPLRLDKTVIEPFTYVAVATDADGVRLSRDDDDGDDADAPRRRCVTAAPYRGRQRIYAAQAVWTLGGHEHAVLGDHLCYDRDPGAPAVTIRAGFGDHAVTGTVHGTNLEVVPAGDEP